MSSALVPYDSGREIGSTNAIGSAIVYGISRLFERMGLMNPPPHTPSSMTTITNQGQFDTGITTTGPIITGNSVALTVQDPAGKRYDVVTTINPKDTDKNYAEAIDVSLPSPDQTFLLKELNNAKIKLNTTDIGGEHYVVPEVATEVFALFDGVIKQDVKGMDSLIDQVQSLIITSYVNNNFKNLDSKQKGELIRLTIEKFKQLVDSDFKEVGMTIIIPDGFAHTFREIGNVFLSLIKNDVTMFKNTDNTRFDPNDSGFSIKIAFINLYEVLVNVIRKIAEQSGFLDDANSENLGGGSRQNKGMFNYAHFIPLRNRSKKHNYATKIKPNSRRHRRNKTSNKRRSRRS